MSHLVTRLPTPSIQTPDRIVQNRKDEPPYSVKYPELVNYWQEDPAFPKRNRIYGNLFYNITNLLHGNSQWGEFWNNWATNEDPGFVDPSDPLKGFRKDAPVFKRITGFKEIPYAEIGSTLK